MATVYPLDPTGISPTNKIVDEIKVVTPPTKITDANFIVPNITPFFKEGFSIRLGTRVLVEGVDYQLVFRHIAASTHFTREIFGGIMFINKQFTGTVRLTYQVLGGEFQNANPDAITEFSKAIGAVRWITFDQILGVPSSFPPAYHEHDLESDLIDMGDVVDAIEKLTLAIVNKSTSAETFAIQRHIDSPAAHTKAAVGLGNVANYPPGTVDDVKQGRTGKYVTTDLLKIWFNTLTMNDFNINLDDFYNRAAIDAKVKSLQDALNLRVTKSVMDAAIAAAVKPVSDRINNFRIDPNSKEFRDAMNSLINSSLSTINSSISTLQGTVNSHTQSIRDILATIASNDTTYRGLFLPKTEFNTYKTANDRAVQGLQTGFNTANGKIATIEGNVSQLTNSVNNSMNTLSQLRNSSSVYLNGNTGVTHNGRNVAYTIRITYRIAESDLGRDGSNFRVSSYGKYVTAVNISNHGSNPPMNHVRTTTKRLQGFPPSDVTDTVFIMLPSWFGFHLFNYTDNRNNEWTISETREKGLAAFTTIYSHVRNERRTHGTYEDIIYIYGD